MKRQLPAEIIAALLILLFVYASISKLLGFELFASQLHISPLLSPISKVIAVVLPTIEIIIAGLLLFKRTQMTGLVGSIILLLLFTIYIMIMLAFYKNLPCSCGGVIAKMTWKEHLIFNLFFIVLCGIAINIKRQSLRNEQINYKKFLSQ